jgi:hypothetical protein
MPFARSKHSKNQRKQVRDIYPHHTFGKKAPIALALTFVAEGDSEDHTAQDKEQANGLGTGINRIERLQQYGCDASRLSE